MSVYIEKKDGVVSSVHISGESASAVMKSIAYLIDLCQERAGMNVMHFQENENHKAIMLIMKEF